MKRWITILALIVVVAVFLVFFLGLEVSFLFEEELRVTTHKPEQFFTATSGEIVSVPFSFELDSFSQCDQRCFVEVRDVSGDQVSDSFTTTSGVKKLYEVEVPAIGEGEIVLIADVSCHNVRTALCRTSEAKQYASSLAVIQYTLSDDQHQAQDIMRAGLNHALFQLEREKRLLEQARLLSERIWTGDMISIHDRTMVVQSFENTLSKAIVEYGAFNFSQLTFTLNSSSLLNQTLLILHQSNEVVDLLQSVGGLDEAVMIAENSSSLQKLIRDVHTVDVNKSAASVRSEVATIILALRSEIIKTLELTEGLSCKEYRVLYNETTLCQGNETAILPKWNYVSVDLPEVSVTLPVLQEPEVMCCAYGTCRVCKGGTPILFIHGHAINERNTPSYSMNVFAKLQAELEKEGFVNAGELDLSTLDGSWGHTPVSVRASYYFISSVGGVELQRSERIENYALRLREIINEVKARNHAESVYLVAHSMGGLVAREYFELFGGDDISKVVFVNVPHRGVDSRVSGVCPLLGAKKECEDLTSGSVFLQRLAQKKLPPLAMINIRSDGCIMGNSTGDGIVTLESAFLKGVEDIVIKSECTDRLQTDLHSNVLDPELHPELLEVLVRELR